MFVNGKRVSRHVLADGDVVSLCEFKLRVELDELPTAALELTKAAPPDGPHLIPVPTTEAPPMRTVKH